MDWWSILQTDGGDWDGMREREQPNKSSQTEAGAFYKITENSLSTFSSPKHARFLENTFILVMVIQSYSTLKFTATTCSFLSDSTAK